MIQYTKIEWGNAIAADITAIKDEMQGITRNNGPAGPPSHVGMTRLSYAAGNVRIDVAGPAAVGELNSLKGRLNSQLSAGIIGGTVETITEADSLVSY